MICSWRSDERCNYTTHMAATSNVPREPSAYRPTIHFHERFHDRYDDDRPPRHLDGKIVDGCITRGEAIQKDGCTYELRETFGGVTYIIVVNAAKGKVVSGYPVGINTEVAEASGRWSSDEIDDILEFIRTDPRHD